MNPTPLSNSGHSSAQRMRAYLLELQARITSAIEGVEGQRGARFLVDPWRKEEHEPLQGEGVTCILEGGRIFERARPELAAFRHPASAGIGGCAF